MSIKANAPVRRNFVVVVDLPNGMRIAGFHRTRGETVRLSAEEARHLLLDGIVEDTPDPAPDQTHATQNGSVTAIGLAH